MFQLGQHIFLAQGMNRWKWSYIDISHRTLHIVSQISWTKYVGFYYCNLFLQIKSIDLHRFSSYGEIIIFALLMFNSLKDYQLYVLYHLIRISEMEIWEIKYFSAELQQSNLCIGPSLCHLVHTWNIADKLLLVNISEMQLWHCTLTINQWNKIWLLAW